MHKGMDPIAKRLLELLTALPLLDIPPNDLSEYRWSLSHMRNNFIPLTDFCNSKLPKQDNSLIKKISDEITSKCLQNKKGPYSFCVVLEHISCKTDYESSTIIFLIILDISPRNEINMQRISLKGGELRCCINLIKAMHYLKLNLTHNCNEPWYHFTSTQQPSQKIYQQLKDQLLWKNKTSVILLLWCWKQSPLNFISLDVIKCCIAPYLLPKSPLPPYLLRLLQAPFPPPERKLPNPRPFSLCLLWPFSMFKQEGPDKVSKNPTQPPEKQPTNNDLLKNH